MEARPVRSGRLLVRAIFWGSLAVGGLACSSESAPPGVAVDAPREDTGEDASSRETLDAGAKDAAPSATEAMGSSDPPQDAGSPSLTALAVSAPASGDAGAVALVPTFSPDVHDYYVRCDAGANALTVSMAASAGASSLLVQPVASPSLPGQTLSVSVTPGQAVVAAATSPAGTTEYWVRCLPADFPPVQWTPHADGGLPTPGYYLVGTAAPTTGCYAMVLDTHGVPVWYSSCAPASGWGVFDVDSVVEGAVSYDALSDEPAEFEVHQLSPPGTTTVAAAGGLNVDLHDLRLLANGDYLVLSAPLEPGVDLTGMQVPLPDGGVETVNGPQTIVACNLLELAPDGTVVWSWTGTDHFDPVADSVSPALLPIGSNLVIDPFHCNSVDVDPTSGNLLVSSRQMSSVFYVERSTGRVLWKMGGAAASKDGATYVSVADPFALQHDARLLPDWVSGCGAGTGHISMFDDESYTDRSARAVIYDVVLGGGDAGSATPDACGDAGSGGASAGTATVTWQYAGTAASAAMGSFRISSDGSRVVGWGLLPGAGFTEVDADGHDLLDFAFGDGSTTYRAIKVPLSSFDLGALRAAAGS